MMQNKKKITLAILVAGVLAIFIAAYLWQAGSRSQRVVKPAGPLEKLTISTLPIYTPAILFIAQEKGFFTDNGLEVAIRLFQTGPMGLAEVKAGRVDLAHVADFVLVGELLKGSKSVRCLGSIVAAEINYLIAQKDHGISQPGDLRGKRIGVPLGTIAEFFLARFLTFNDLSLGEVKVINLNPAEMSEALVNDRVDAVMVWDPVTYEIKKRLGEKIISWPGQSGQKFYNILVATDEFLKAKPLVLERLFRALDQAEIFVKSNREESINIVAKHINLDKSLFENSWGNSDYELSFDQGLLIAMEDEARWMIRNKLVNQTEVPNFLNYFDAEPLARAVPGAVQIFIPKGEGRGVPGPSEAKQGR